MDESRNAKAKRPSIADIVAGVEPPFKHQYKKVNDKQFKHGNIKMILPDGIKKIEFVSKNRCEHSTPYGDDEIYNAEKDILPANDDNDDGPIRSLPSSSFSGNSIETTYTIDGNGNCESKVHQRRYKLYIDRKICGCNGCCCIILICLICVILPIASGLIYVA